MKTVSLELSKQLKESGFPQDTYFYYQGNKAELTVGKGFAFSNKDNMLTYEGIISIAAPTADEILEQLPMQIGEFLLTVSAYPAKKWFVGYLDNERDSLFIPADDIDLEFNAETIADAAAMMYVYLSKNVYLYGGN